jgi:tellurite resistance protein TerC
MTFTAPLWLWIGFNVFVVAMLALDLGVFNRKAHEVSLREALTWSCVWIVLSLLFDAGLYFWQGSDVAIQFLTGYLIEKSLSIDNIFIFVLIFAAFNVPAAYQHRVLFWGVLGALVMRGILIAVGTVLIDDFHWILYVFGAFLIVTGIRMAVQKETSVQPERNPILKLVRRVMPVTQGYERDRFFVRNAGKLAVTPLLLVLVVIETTDLIFAVDSIPAIFAITNNPFLVYTSNVLAVLGLRSLYFVFANILNQFHYLKLGLAVVLAFVGVKMVLTDVYSIPSWLSLVVIVFVLTIAIVASLLRTRRLNVKQVGERNEPASGHPDA